MEVRTKYRGVGTTAWNAPVTSKSEKAGPGSEIRFNAGAKYIHQSVAGDVGPYWNATGIILLILCLHRLFLHGIATTGYLNLRHTSQNLLQDPFQSGCQFIM